MEKIKILIIEDNKYDLELIIRELKKNKFEFEYINVYEFDEVKKQIIENPPDIIFSDYRLQSFTGLEALKFRNEYAPLIPFIKITGTLDEERAVEIIKSGADDYILKQNLSRLGPAVLTSMQKMYLNKKKISAEKKLRESEEKFSKIFHFSPVPSCIVNFESGLIMDVNESYSQFSGYTETDLIGRYIFDFNFINPEIYEEHIKKSLNNNYAVKNYEMEVITKNRDLKFVLANFLYITIEDVKYIIVKFVDITQRKIVERELSTAKERAEEMNKLKTIFLTNLSHEFRTPLNGILGFSDMLFSEIENDEHKSYVQAIQISGKRLLDTFNDLIDLSIVESGKIALKKEAINLVNITTKIFENYKDSIVKELEFRIDVKSENLICFVDITAYKKIVTKLLDNAVKFTHKGFVKLVLDKFMEDGAQFIDIKIIDTGIGISPEDLEIVFDRFRQSSEGLRRNYEGTGIGLSIARGFVELMGGSISVTSKIGEGSEFKVVLPVQNRANSVRSTKDTVVYYRENEIAREDTWDMFRQDKKILLVEDNDVDCFYINKLLSDHFNLTIVKDSLKAEKYYSTEKFDAIMLDIQFTAGVSGVEVLKGIRNSDINKKTPLIASTAMAMSGDRERLLSEGFDDYIQKPFDKNGLFKVLSKYIPA